MLYEGDVPKRTLLPQELKDPEFDVPRMTEGAKVLMVICDIVRKRTVTEL